MTDKILDCFLQCQFEQGMALARESDLLELFPRNGPPVTRYAARFHCNGLVRNGNGPVQRVSGFEVGIWLPPSYLRKVDPIEVLTWLGPPHVFHPNIRAPFICVGRLTAGTPLVDILYQVFEVITYNKVTVREDDALNRDACVWARQNMDQFPIFRGPLKRRRIRLHVEEIRS
jgi:hypothetical protein